MFFYGIGAGFWKNFCEGIGRPELFEKWPGSKYADHAKGNRELHLELKEIFKVNLRMNGLNLAKRKIHL